MAKLGNVLLGSVLGLGFCGYVASQVDPGSGSTGHAPGTGETPGARPAPVLSALTVSARDLVRAYDKNEVAADNVYRGKILRVPGRVTGIGKDITDDPYLTMGDSFKGVNCYFDSRHANVIAAVSKGDSVVFQGKCTGLTLGTVMLKDCALVDDEPAKK